MLIQKNYSVEYAHRLMDHNGKCKFLHGHSGKVKIVFDGEVTKETGMVVDFGTFEWLKTLVNLLDHSVVLQQTDFLVKQLEPFSERMVRLEGPPTAENLCLFLEDLILAEMQCVSFTTAHTSLKLMSITFEETEGNSVTLENWRVK
jgi:6-pyruvoyltetrahydropterin/6-carboxytetrahydropterin synthase